MKIKQLGEIIFTVYSNGKNTGERLDENTIKQMALLAYGNVMRRKFIESKSLDDWGEADITFISPILDVKEFELPEANGTGMRRVNMKEYDLVRLPNNGHITNIYPIGECGKDQAGKTITLVRPGEEKFYTKEQFNFFKFGVVVGRGINTYNLPPCVKKVGVETTYNSDDLEIDLDVGYEVGLAVFNILFEEKKFPVKVVDNPYDANAVDLKRNINANG